MRADLVALLHACLEGLRVVGILLQPLMPKVILVGTRSLSLPLSLALSLSLTHTHTHTHTHTDTHTHTLSLPLSLSSVCLLCEHLFFFPLPLSSERCPLVGPSRSAR